MPNHKALQELQSRLDERLALVKSQEPQKSWLAIESGGFGFLLNLLEIGEIFPASTSTTTICTVPHTQAWFLGVVNLRGHLHGVVHLALFFDLSAVASSGNLARVIALNGHLELNCALWVDALMGLRNEAQLQPVTRTVASDSVQLPDFLGGQLQDEKGRIWQEVLLSKLIQQKAFLNIAVQI